VPFEEWDWAREDPDFYKSFMKFPEAKDPAQFNNTKWNRWSHATHGTGKPDFRPRVFLKKMRIEFVIIIGSVCFGLSKLSHFNFKYSMKILNKYLFVILII
jgi:hypothetical protein